jgi:hypothetical protein
MASNVAIQLYRGLLANLPATTGKPGVLAWTTDSNELFVDNGSAFQKLSNDIAVFTAASQSAMTALAAKIGDLCTRTDVNQTFILTAFPATTAANWTPIAITSGTGIQGLVSGTAHQWVSYIDQAGVQHLTQPSFSDISGSLTQTQLPATIGAGSSLTSIDCGTF